jgi:hypothetical protein
MWDLTSAVADSSVVATLPSSMVPSIGDYDFPTFDVGTGNYAGVFRVDLSGNVKIVFVNTGSVPAGTKFRCTLSYVI